LCAQVIPGELTIVTGVPNSGKSEWIDALLANLAEQHDWCFALCSMEKKVGRAGAGVGWRGLVEWVRGRDLQHQPSLLLHDSS
jgi:hypothetical protein